MNRIFIEAKNKRTPEYFFLKTIIGQFFPGKEVDFVCIDGIGNLFNETNVNQMIQAQTIGEQVIVLADADYVAKGTGYVQRDGDMKKGMANHLLSFPYLLYPNNHDDGVVEVLMEAAARRDLHAVFFDCFEDYENCVSGVKDASGKPIYNTPNLKGKLHTYMTAHQLSSRLRNGLGTGDWLFHDISYWNLNVAELQPLKDFLAANLK